MDYESTGVPIAGPGADASDHPIVAGDAAEVVEAIEPPSRPHDDARIDAFQQKLGHDFASPDLLLRALTHRSYANENTLESDNQRLEYLGDAVLDLVISTELFHRYPDLPEGRLSYLRSRLVREESLAHQARQVELGDHLLLGRGEEMSGGRDKPSLLADAYEAVLAAVYLDGGYDAAARVIVARFEELLSTVTERRLVGDHKTRLQELVQAERDERPRYQITNTDGPPHARIYTATVSVGEAVWGTGSGCSKKAAQQDAARDALERMASEACLFKDHEGR